MCSQTLPPFSRMLKTRSSSKFRASRVAVFTSFIVLSSTLLYIGFMRPPHSLRETPAVRLPDKGTYSLTSTREPTISSLKRPTSSVVQSKLIGPTASPTTDHSQQFGHSDEWTFDPSRDGWAYGLSNEQCEAAFSDLLDEINRAVEYQKTAGQIKPEDINISWKKYGAVRAAIIDQQVDSPNQKPYQYN